MDLEVTLPTKAAEITPMLITSPCNHSGGALIQRVLCSSKSAICFGDNMFDEVNSLIDWAIERIEIRQELRSIEAKILKDALDMQPQKWMPELAPDFDLHSSSIFSVIYNLPYTAQQFARENQRKEWGLARAGVPSLRLNDLLSVFPKSHGYFIYRNPMDTVRDRLRDNPDVQISELCDEWSDLMRQYTVNQHDRLTKIRYEDLVDQPEKIFTYFEGKLTRDDIDVDSVDAGVEAETESFLELSEEQVKSIQQQCSDMLSVHYPELAED